MPTLKQDKDALDFLVKNPDSEYTPAIKQKLGVNDDDVKAWGWASQNIETQADTATKIRNKVFDKVAERQDPVDVDGGGADLQHRVVVKNLIDEEPNLQEEYLKRKGYNVKRIEDKFYVKRPGESRYAPVDPEGFDRWDILDVAGDAIEAVASAVGTGAKALGLIGAPATGGASILPSMALSGAIGGGLETAKQGIGMAVGARDELNPSLITKKTIVNAAIPGVIGVGSKMFKGAAEGLKIATKEGSGVLKKNADEIIAAAETIGAKATPGQLLNGKTAQQLESSLWQQHGKIGGVFLRKQITTNNEAAQETAEQLVSVASKLSREEIGEKAIKEMADATKVKLAPAEEIYKKYETMFQGKGKDWIGGIIQDNLDDVSAKIAHLKEANKFDTQTTSFLDGIENQLPNIKSLQDLKNFRTNLGGMLEVTASGNKKNAVAQLYGPVTDLRAKALMAAAEKSGNREIFETALKDIQLADNIYKETAEGVQNALLRRGQKVRGTSPKKLLEQFAEGTEEGDVLKKVLKTSDPKKITAIAKQYPKAFETLRTGKIAEIAKKAEKNGVVNPKKLGNIIDALPKQTQILMFGEDGVKRAKALKTFFDSTPERVGPSGTPEGLGLMDVSKWMRQLHSLGQSAFYSLVTRPRLSDDSLSKIGSALDTPAARGLGVFGVNQVYPDQQYRSKIIP
jgi:hypothetical protein